MSGEAKAPRVSDEKLVEVLDMMDADAILAIPGVRDLVEAHFADALESLEEAE